MPRIVSEERRAEPRSESKRRLPSIAKISLETPGEDSLSTAKVELSKERAGESMPRFAKDAGNELRLTLRLSGIKSHSHYEPTNGQTNKVN